MSIDSLKPPDSPRLAGIDEQHARALAESGVELPPILVHAVTRQVIDGMHRIRAAVLRGRREIEARLYDGDGRDLFVLAVEANIAHGLPLTLAERTAAATRIVSSHPCWSDGAIASIAGLSDKTVASIRCRSRPENPESNTRIGKDGRARPLSSAEGRRLAGLLIQENPGLSLREIARAAGVAPSTVLDVRERLNAGQDPVPTRLRGAKSAKRVRKPRGSQSDPADTLRGLRNDPSLRLSESGRALLRWLDTHTVDAAGCEQLLSRIPTHCSSVIASLARANATTWAHIADSLEVE
ncbi:ParB/RepB/Spo0J family partition protein [Lentzea waywayandensis]|uniref:ParB/RepB/Spo0J family partition protein n=1 Tax=Lentzea waywayandensis TaxID=84724 RepID=UPI000B813D4B|nr:winged helix-turn-helix transcriptional regulator [Lentzea waywayandensis]